MAKVRPISRRFFVGGSLAVSGIALAGCTTSSTEVIELTPQSDRTYLAMYGPKPQERFPIPAVDLNQVDPQFYRREVKYQTKEPVGTIIVDTQNFYLYLVQENGKAMRYGVGLGRAGFEWNGRARVAWKQPWPTWTPPEEMIARQPELAIYSADNGGMQPGLSNPLGARALYIFQGNVDTLYRIHGTPEAFSIGKAVSSGCVRLLNQDIIDLYERVPKESPIVVI